MHDLFLPHRHSGLPEVVQLCRIEVDHAGQIVPGEAPAGVSCLDQQGTVVAVGPGSKDEPMEVKVGETVLYGKYAGTEVTVDNKKYLIVKQSDILAII